MKTSQPEQSPVVYIIDDDASLRDSLGDLIRSVGLRAELLASTSEFVALKSLATPGCLVLDVRLPGQGGLDFQQALAKAGIQIPIIFMTGHGDIPMSVRAMKAGAVEFLTKPLREQDLLDAIQAALELDRARAESEHAIAALQLKFKTLSPREREVMALVTSGLMNKQVAAEIGITEVTVKLHRSNVMHKMGAKSLAELVRMADALGGHRGTS